MSSERVVIGSMLFILLLCVGMCVFCIYDCVCVSCIPPYVFSVLCNGCLAIIKETHRVCVCVCLCVYVCVSCVIPAPADRAT